MCQSALNFDPQPGLRTQQRRDRAGHDNHFRARDEFEPVSREELLDRLRCGEAMVLDVRPQDEFAHGHEADALNIPLTQIERRLAELPACDRRSETRSQSRSDSQAQGDSFVLID